VALRLFGIPITIDPAFFFGAVALGIMANFASPRPENVFLMVVAVAIGTIAHELGHALAYRFFGCQSAVRLHVLGGVAWPTEAAALSAGQRAVITLAGPLTGLALGLPLVPLVRTLSLSGDAAPPEVLVTFLLVTTAGASLLNLAPVLPLDGGQLVRTVLDSATGGRGLRPALVTSVLFSGLIAVVALRSGLRWWLIGLAAIALCAYDLRAVFVLPGAEKAAAADEQRRRLVEADAALAGGDPLRAEKLAGELLHQTYPGPVRAAAANIGVWANLIQGRTAGALDVAERAGSALAGLDVPLSAVQAAGGRDRALDLLRSTFTAAPGETSGLLLTRALVQAGRLDEAVAVVSGPAAAKLGNNPAAVVGRALFGEERFEDAARLGAASFERDPHPTLAYNVACAWARHGRPDEALRWLDRAVDAGYRDAGELETDAELETLRGRPELRDLRHRMERRPLGPGNR